MSHFVTIREYFGVSNVRHQEEEQGVKQYLQTQAQVEDFREP